MSSTLTARFREEGFVVVRGLLRASEIKGYVEHLTALAARKERWTQPDGVNRHREFWPVIFNERLLTTVREIFGNGVRYLPHNDLHVGFSSFSWHRDSVNREAGRGPDWDEAREPYQLARVGIYLQRFADSRFKLGLVKGSHRRSELTSGKQRRVHRRTGAVANVLSGVSRMDLVGDDADWVATDAGDCVIFDPRILHTGSRFHGSKYAIFVAYGIESAHFHRHSQYYLTLRSDLGYAPIAPALAERLRAANLLAAAPPADLPIEGAWVPSATYTYVARRFK